MDKTCTKCGECKPFTSYSKNKLGLDGKQPRCKSCLLDQQREYRKTNGYGAALKYKYGITLAEYHKTIKDQNNQCPLCDIIFDSAPTRNTKPVVDHNHSTGKVRAIICHPCNVSIGLIKENTETLNRMIKYLEAK